MVEVAVRWLEIGRYDQATRWIDEALRHQATPMLYYLQAYAFFAGKRMEVEIPNLLSRAAKLGIQPPYPYRNFERRAIEQLSENFPQDIQLAKYRHLMA